MTVVLLARRPYVLAATLVVTAAGCGWNDAVDSRTATAGLPTTRQLVEEHEWVLDRAESSVSVDDQNPVTLSVRDDVVSGTAPCNTYRGEISLGDDTVEIGDIALTTRACGGSTMRAEDEFVAALRAVDSVAVDDDDGDRLVLRNDDGRLLFRAYDADDLLAATWTITNVATGDSIDSVLAGTEPTVTFDEDGDATMATGCNSATTTWELDGDALSVDPVRLTRMSCPSPAGVIEQEDALITALESADRVEITPGKLTVLDAEGAIALVAEAGS